MHSAVPPGWRLFQLHRVVIVQTKPDNKNTASRPWPPKGAAQPHGGKASGTRKPGARPRLRGHSGARPTEPGLPLPLRHAPINHKSHRTIKTSRTLSKTWHRTTATGHTKLTQNFSHTLWPKVQKNKRSPRTRARRQTHVKKHEIDGRRVTGNVLADGVHKTCRRLQTKQTRKNGLAPDHSRNHLQRYISKW